MIIDKKRVDKSLRRIRALYYQHAKGELSPSGFATKARAEIHALYMQDTVALIKATASRFISELQAYEAQFGLQLEFSDVHIKRVARGYRGLRASMYVRSKHYLYYSGSTEIFIGPIDEWTSVAYHTYQEREELGEPSLYTKRRKRRWKALQDFDFPDLLQQIKEATETPEPAQDEEDDIPF